MKQEDNLLKQLKGLKHRVGRKEREELEERVKEASTEGERRATYILKEETIEKVKEVAKMNALILVKASRPLAMEEVVEKLKN